MRPPEHNTLTLLGLMARIHETKKIFRHFGRKPRIKTENIYFKVLGSLADESARGGCRSEDSTTHLKLMQSELAKLVPKYLKKTGSLPI